MRFNKAKCRELHLGQSNLSHMYGLRELTESSPVKKDLGFLMNKKMNMNQLCALEARKANCILSCIFLGDQQEEGENYPFLLCLQDTQFGILCPGTPTARKVLEWSHRAGPQRCSKGWIISPMKKGLGFLVNEKMNCSAWRTEGSGETSLQLSST